jgi:hypothetical protein
VIARELPGTFSALCLPILDKTDIQDILDSVPFSQ